MVLFVYLINVNWLINRTYINTQYINKIICHEYNLDTSGMITQSKQQFMRGYYKYINTRRTSLFLNTSCWSYTSSGFDLLISSRIPFMGDINNLGIHMWILSGRCANWRISILSSTNNVFHICATLTGCTAIYRIRLSLGGAVVAARRATPSRRPTLRPTPGTTCTV